jgi:hypothetical protein
LAIAASGSICLSAAASGGEEEGDGHRCGEGSIGDARHNHYLIKRSVKSQLSSQTKSDQCGR